MELQLAAEGWSKTAYKYMQGPGGTRGMVTRGGWTKDLRTMVHWLLSLHPQLYLLVCEVLKHWRLSFNLYDLKYSFVRGKEAQKQGKTRARQKGWEFSHTDINYWGAWLLYKLGHRFDTYYQIVVPIRQGKSGLSFAKVH
jgi:hypothetical protein